MAAPTAAPIVVAISSITSLIGYVLTFKATPFLETLARRVAKVCDAAPEKGYGVSCVAEKRVARTTQQAAYFTRRMVMVHTEASSLAGCSATCCTLPALKLVELGILALVEPVRPLHCPFMVRLTPAFLLCAPMRGAPAA